MEQVGIAFTGVIAVFLSQAGSASMRKWACIFGLIGQPFWFYASFKATQWGIFGLSFLYAAAWMRGFYNNWIKR
ncbi:hypothetical protein [Herbaspirillum autotrophicum]|uniref:hypothetical protein n=1 Tax=Herbaspirillum autotrophicum TaxID=180195 RepID=UPI00067D9177|nr:hypothetical protein [Herbaspirillum autotrophicum]